MLQPTPNKFYKAFPFLLVLLAFLLYGNTLGHQYAYDDAAVIQDNSFVAEGLSAAGKIFTTTYWAGYTDDYSTGMYRPLPLLSFALETDLFGPGKPMPSHFINVLLYAISLLVLWSLLLALFGKFEHINSDPTGSYFVAMATCLLFVAHPVHTEVVANLKSRDELLGFLFSLLALRCMFWYVYGSCTMISGIPRILLSMFFFACALLCKESMLTLLAIFPLAVLLFAGLGQGKPFGRSLKDSLLSTIPYALVAVVWFQLRKTITGGVLATHKIEAFDNPILAADNPLAMKVALLGKYLWKLIFPHPLSYDYSFNALPLYDWSDWQTLLSLFAFLGLAILAIYQTRMLIVKKAGSADALLRAIPLFGLLFFLASISIYSNFVFTSVNAFAERSLYTASLGGCLLIAWGLYWLRQKAKAHGTLAQLNPALIGLVLLMIGFSFKTVSRNPAWYDSLSLFGTDVKTVSESARANQHYAEQLKKAALELPADSPERGRMLAEAELHLIKAIKIWPTFATAYRIMGDTYSAQKEHKKAAVAFEKLIQLNPENPRHYIQLADAYQAEKKYDEQIAALERGLPFDTDQSLGNAFYNNIGVAKILLKDYSGAVAVLQEAIANGQDSIQTYQNLGLALRENGDCTAGSAAYEKVLAISPNDKKALKGLAICAQRMGNWQASEQFYRTMLSHHQDAAGWLSLGILLDDNGVYEKAVEAYETALQLRPIYPQAARNMGNTYFKQQRWNQAIAAYTQAVEMKANYSGAWQAMSLAYTKLGDQKNAKRCADKAAALTGK